MSSHKAPRVLFVLKYREQPYDADSGWGDTPMTGKFLSSGLYNSARMVCDMLQAGGVVSKLVHVIDNNAIHREIVAFGATHVIIEAFWVVPEKFDVLAQACPNVKFIVRNHSETPFLAGEGMAFDWIMRYVDYSNVAISCNAPRMLREARMLVSKKHPHWSAAKVADKVPYLPNYYPVGPISRGGAWNGPDIWVGCFGAIRPLKNHMVQAIAAIEFAESVRKRLRFYINAGRVEMYGQPILRNLRMLFSHYEGRHELVECAWRPHEEFRQLVAQMDILTQVSFSETFNIVAADAVTQGVPLIASKEIPWSSPLVQCDPTNSRDIAQRMRLVWEAHKRWPEWNPNLRGLRRYNAASRKLWLEQFPAS